MSLIKNIQEYEICKGQKPSVDGDVIHHVIPSKNVKNETSDDEVVLEPFKSKTYYRTKNCQIFILNEKNDLCKDCQLRSQLAECQISQQKKKLETPAKLKAPLSVTHKDKVVLALKQERLKCNQLTAELEKMKGELDRNTHTVDHSLNNDFVNILSSTETKITPLMNLFWQQQKRLFQSNPKGMRYHPMIIRYCLSLASKSRSCYEELRNSGILKLPSLRTLTDYKNYIRPKPGFRKQVIDNLTVLTSEFFNTQRYVVLMFDEMKIRSNLVFNKHSEELIGFVDLGDPDVNFNCFKEQNELASYTLVFYVRGLSTNLKFSLGHFATNGISAVQLIPIFWEAVTILELSCNLWVVATTADGASPNRRFFNLIAEEDDGKRHKALNIVKPWRFIYLFSDGPHLMKTLRNCLASFSRNLWNEGKYLSWQHIVRIHNKDLDNGLKELPKLTQDHINLSSYSKMTVRFAVQVLSETVANSSL